MGPWRLTARACAAPWPRCARPRRSRSSTRSRLRAAWRWAVGVPHGTGEIAALRVLLDLLDLRGRTVTADAMHCQRETAQAILRKDRDPLRPRGRRRGL